MIEYKYGTVNLHIHVSHEITAVTQTKRRVQASDNRKRKEKQLIPLPLI